MSPVSKSPTGKAYWRSLDDLADTPRFREFVEREFPAYADEMMQPKSRRNFLKLMGASMAMAGMTACRWPSEEILPFASRPEDYVPGVPRHYATAMELGGVATGLLVRSYDGRPVKIEGNPEHPASLGASSPMAQAALLELYDPDRSRNVVQRSGGEATKRSLQELVATIEPHFAALQAAGGRGFRVLSEATSSPSVHALRERLLERYPEARWVEYEAVSRDNAREGSKLAFGRPCRTHLHLDRAELIVSLDEDFLQQHPAAVRYARDWADARRTDSGLNPRLWAFEPTFTLTGAVADQRVSMPSGRIPAAAAWLASELFASNGLEFPSGAQGLKESLDKFRSHAVAAEVDGALAAELVAMRGRSLVVAGPRQPAELHALAALMNEALGNVGQTLSYTADPDGERSTHVDAIGDLASEMGDGAVGTLLIIGGNPAFDAPADTEFEKRMAQVGMIVRLGLHEDETSHASTWHVPRAHFLEAWGDGRDYQGTLSIAQPLIAPLFGGKSAIEVLAHVIDGGGHASGHELVRETFFAGLTGGEDREKAWRKALHDGLVAGSEWPEEQPTVRASSWSAAIEGWLQSAEAPSAGRFEMNFAPSPAVYDGRFANNGWLQELPEPISKLTWDNAVLISPATAAELDCKPGDLVQVDHDGGSVELPVEVLPGQAAGSVTIHLGYGRRQSGSVGQGVGFDVYPLRSSDGMGAKQVSIKKGSGHYDLATTQDHFVIDALGMAEREKRVPDLIHEFDRSDYLADPEGAVKHGHPLVQLWEEPTTYDGYRWGMTIDLNSCTGCNACIIACQSENNTPVVGKAEVLNSREMHWIRVDRYFSGDPENARLAHQPMTCQHCENAPCEQVCPVAATMHDDDGLNVMVYNRCIGTRYCANNCPYKVRRFNFFNNHKNESAVEAMVYNPEVTVRTRGVMEKCSFCVQRINQAKISSKNDGREIVDGEVTTACEQACPTRAITFGDLNGHDADGHHSRVREKFHEPRSYAVFDAWNFRPRNRYLAKLRNPSPGSDPADRG